MAGCLKPATHGRGRGWTARLQGRSVQGWRAACVTVHLASSARWYFSMLFRTILGRGCMIWKGMFRPVFLVSSSLYPARAPHTLRACSRATNAAPTCAPLHTTAHLPAPRSRHLASSLLLPAGIKYRASTHMRCVPLLLQTFALLLWMNRRAALVLLRWRV